MTFRSTATIYLLVGTLLVCPYFCLPWAAANETACLARGCQGDRCCPSPASVPNGDRPGDSDSRTQGGDCLCHGAVLQSPTTPPSLDSGLAAFLSVNDLLVAARSSILGDNQFAVAHTACHFPSADSGREVRALIESLLL